MKMLNNGLEVDGFATSRTPIQSPRSTKRVVVPRCAARPPEPPAQVHPDHHAEDGAGAVAEPVDGVEPADGAYAREQKGYKNSVLPSTVPKCVVVVDTRWPLDGNANAPRLDIAPPAKRPRRGQVGGVAPALIVGIGKAGYGITKALGEHQQKQAKKISDKRWRDYMSGKRKSYGGESFNCSLM